ncbi:MAG: LptF/LptG family permease [bacterium]|nr:LptF/LptG family permease [bacterium]
MILLDRYIIRELLLPFVFGVIAFTSIIAGSSVLFPIIKTIVKYNIGVGAAFQIFLYRVPAIISLTLPMSMLLAAILVFGRFNSDGEMVALRASGVSLYRIMAPVILLGMVVSVLNIMFNERVVPIANYNAEQLRESLKKTAIKIKQNANVTEYDANGYPSRIINVRELDGQELTDVMVVEFLDGQMNRVIRADSGRWELAGGWEFRNGVMHSFFKDDLKKVMVIEFEKEFIDLNVNLLMASNQDKEAQEMSADELKNAIAFKQSTGSDATQDLMEYYMRFAIPFACFIFSLVGAAFGMRPQRSTSSVGFGVSLAIIIIYYLLYSIGMALGLAKVLPPIVAAWLPNIISGVAGAYVLRQFASK